MSSWKDLNFKLVVSLCRDFVWHWDDEALSRHCGYLLRKSWPLIEAIVETASDKWDKDGDGLIENEAKPDQTYDSWVMNGPSSYCNSLWIAALVSALKMGRMLKKDEKEMKKIGEKLERASKAFDDKLWNDEGGFYVFDTSARGRKTVMSDQLCGLWYVALTAGNNDEGRGFFSGDKCRKALRTIYQYNVLKFGEGRLKGAVNGMTFPEGVKDESSVQSEEIWTGVTYALASLLISFGMVEEGFKTAEGIYKTVFEECGLAFETPEALYETEHYRAIGYMRPLSIWSIYEAFKRNAQ